MLDEATEFIFEARPKDGKPFRDTVWALDLMEAWIVISNRYDVSTFRKFSIEPVRDI